MTNKAEYFAQFETVAAISRQMLVSARRARWDDVVILQKEYQAALDAMKGAQNHIELSDADRTRKFELVRQILVDDAEIRDLANPRLAKLSALLTRRPARAVPDLCGAR